MWLQFKCEFTTEIDSEATLKIKMLMGKKRMGNLMQKKIHLKLFEAISFIILMDSNNEYTEIVSSILIYLFCIKLPLHFFIALICATCTHLSLYPSIIFLYLTTIDQKLKGELQDNVGWYLKLVTRVINMLERKSDVYLKRDLTLSTR